MPHQIKVQAGTYPSKKVSGRPSGEDDEFMQKIEKDTLNKILNQDIDDVEGDEEEAQIKALEDYEEISPTPMKGLRQSKLSMSKP